jgi:hypothetical protein
MKATNTRIAEGLIPLSETSPLVAISSLRSKNMAATSIISMWSLLVLISEVNNIVSYLTLPEGCTDGLNAPVIVVRQKKALHSLKQAPPLLHNDINNFFLSLKFSQSMAHLHIHLCCEGSLMLLYSDAISLLHLDDSTTATIEVKARVLGIPNITNLSPVWWKSRIRRFHTGPSLGSYENECLVSRSGGTE